MPIKHTMFSFAGWWESLRTSNIKGRIQCNNFYRVFIQHKSMRYRPVKVTQPKETAESSETSFFRILSPIVPGPLSIVSFLSYIRTMQVAADAHRQNELKNILMLHLHFLYTYEIFF